MNGYHGRYHRLDEIRGITLISMILYHGCWDAVYLLGCDWTWYHSEAAYWWQQSIAWTFILLSGFCWQLGKHHLRRGLTVFGAGLLVMAVTLLVMPESRIVFGVLTLIGSSMLLMIPVDVALRKTFIGSDPGDGNPTSNVGSESGTPQTNGIGNADGTGEHSGLSKSGAGVGFIISGVLFFLTRNVNRGWLGFEGLNIAHLPEGWYSNSLTTYMGFPEPGFFSTDYFSLIPWFFLFLCGYFLFGIAGGAKAPQCAPLHKKYMAPIRWMGRHSLLVYLLHQPALYGLVMILQQFT